MTEIFISDVYKWLVVKLSLGLRLQPTSLAHSLPFKRTLPCESQSEKTQTNVATGWKGTPKLLDFVRRFLPNTAVSHLGGYCRASRGRPMWVAALVHRVLQCSDFQEFDLYLYSHRVSLDTQKIYLTPGIKSKLRLSEVWSKGIWTSASLDKSI